MLMYYWRIDCSVRNRVNCLLYIIVAVRLNCDTVDTNGEGEITMVFDKRFDRHLVKLVLMISIPSLIIGFILGALIF